MAFKDVELCCKLSRSVYMLLTPTLLLLSRTRFIGCFIFSTIRHIQHVLINAQRISIVFIFVTPASSPPAAIRGEDTSRLHAPTLVQVSPLNESPSLLLHSSNMRLPFCSVFLLASLCSTPFLLPSAECSHSCPDQCVCYEHAELVDCHARGFEHVPRGLPHGTWLLELGGNNLTQIGSRAFTGLWSLRVLVLSDSQIQDIQPQVKTN